jgi:hypothetical protein
MLSVYLEEDLVTILRKTKAKLHKIAQNNNIRSAEKS